MTLDRKLFSEDQPHTETAVSTNVLDFGEGTGNIGDGQSIRVYAQIVADFTTCISVQTQHQTSDDKDTWATVLEGPVVAVADAVAGKVLLEVTVPKNMGRYHRINYALVLDATGEPPVDIPEATGKVTAGYVPAP